MEDMTMEATDAGMDADNMPGVSGGTDSPSDSGGEGIEEPSQERSVKFALEDGPAYEITESKIRKYYNIPPEEELSDKEWKMAVSAMKQDLRASYVRNKSTQAMKDYEEKQQSFGQLLELLQTPESAVQVLEHLGVNFKDLAENYLLSLIEEQALPENERALREKERQLAEREMQIKQAEAAKQAEVERAQMEHAAETINKQIISAMDQYGLPRTEFSVMRIAHYMHEAGKRGIDVSAADVAPYVKDEIDKINRSIINNADPDKLSEILGEEKLKAIRQKDLEKIKSPMNVKSSSAPAPKKQKPPAPNADWKQVVRERARQS